MQQATVRRVSAEDRKVLVDLFVAAFEGDPWYRWLYPGHDYPARAREWFDLVTARVWPRADAWLDEEGEAGAIWIRPGREFAPPDDLVAIVRLLARQLGDRAPQVMAASASTAAHEPQVPHALCLYLGVRPERRGRGIGSAIMRTGLERYDREGVPAYLNSTNPRNVSFYERLGFRVSGVSEVAPGVSLRAMVREASA